MYCVTNKSLEFLEKLPFKLIAVGEEKFSDKYLRCDTHDNIYYKEKYYSELTFHYWYWKNMLNIENKNWVGFCQKRRIWIKNDLKNNNIEINSINDHLLTEIDEKYSKYDSFICQPIYISGAKKTKMIKRGWKNLIKNPSIFFSKKKETISFHFDMHHGYKNLEKAIKYLETKDRNHFLKYVNEKNYYNPNIMCIAKPDILEIWFKDLFNWLSRCEAEFGFDNLNGYDTLRLYAYLAERYMSYWFKKYTKFHEQPWAIIKI